MDRGTGPCARRSGGLTDGDASAEPKQAVEVGVMEVQACPAGSILVFSRKRSWKGSNQGRADEMRSEGRVG